MLTSVEKLGFAEAMVNAEQFDHVVICYPMAAENGAHLGQAWVDSRLISMWQTTRSVRSEGKIVHVNGNPLAKARSERLWLDAGLRNFITPEAIEQRRQQNQESFSASLQQARAAAAFCAKARFLREDLDRKNPIFRPPQHQS